MPIATIRNTQQKPNLLDRWRPGIGLPIASSRPGGSFAPAKSMGTGLKPNINTISNTAIKPKQPSTTWGDDAERAIINQYLKDGRRGNSYVNGIIDRYTASQKSNAPAALTTQQQAEQAMNEAKQKTEASKTNALGYYDQAASGFNNLGGQISSNTNRALGYYQPVMDKLNSMQGDLINPDQMASLTANRKATLAASGQNLTGAFGDADSGIQTGRRLGIAMDTANQSANLPIDMQLNIAAQNRASNLGLLNQQAGLAGSMANVGSNDIGNQFNLANLGLNVAGGKAGIDQSYQYDPGTQYFNQLGTADGEKTKQGTGVSYVPSPIRIGTSGIHIGVGGNTISSGRNTPTLKGNTISGMRKLPTSNRFRK
jgi:hypothetical protein